MSERITTAAGDDVAFDRYGEGGPSVVFVAGAGPWRAIDPVTTATARALAERGVASVVPDRLGRGESRADAPITLERDQAALRALCELADAPVVLCGHSSGCALSLRAAVDGLPVAGLVLWEAPIQPPGGDTAQWADEVIARIAAGDPEAAFDTYMRDLPPELVGMIRQAPGIVEQAPSLQPDAEALAWAASTPHEELFSSITIPVLTCVGAKSFPGMAGIATALAAALPAGRTATVAGAMHSWDPDAMADVLADACGVASV